MRLYPAAWMTERVAVEDDKLGEYAFPQGTIIISFLFGLHRDPHLWKDASVFNPQRFIDDPSFIIQLLLKHSDIRNPAVRYEFSAYYKTGFV